ncbi:MAG: hypothetical protein J5713_04295, partial [Clostridia bacterium]|nr:hypothetical protein [Clostridia bacterium]
FVVAKDGFLSIVKCGDDRVYFDGGMKGMILPQSLGITALRVKKGIIICKFNNGSVGAFDFFGKTLLSQTKTKGAGGVKIDKAIKVLDSGLLGVTATYDKDGKSGYTSIYRPTTSGELKSRGELVCRVKNESNDLSYVLGFDNAYVSVIGNSAGEYMFAVPSHTGSEVQNLAATNGFIETSDQENYYVEITYIGKGRFLVHEDWTVASTDNYSYYDGNNYYVFKRKIFDAKSNTLSDYTGNSDKVFLSLSNSYYSTEKGTFDVSTYLKPGYMFAAYGLFIGSDKVGNYDQYILDENLNIVMSLTGNFDVVERKESRSSVSVFDLIMTASDGNYYVPYLPSKIAVYNSKGELQAENKTYTIKSQNIANGVIIACIVDPDGGEDELYTMFNLNCQEVTEAYTLENGESKRLKYNQIAAFRGYYTIAKRPNESGKATYYLVGKDGFEVETMTDGSVPFADIATTSGNSAIFKIGCYMFKADSGQKDAEGKTIYNYGIKNFNVNSEKNVIIPATMSSGCVLYAPSSSPTDVFVFEKIESTDGSFTYAVHRLI